MNNEVSNTANTTQTTIARGSSPWHIAFGAMVMMACSIGAINNCFSLYTIPVTEGLGISRSSFSAGQSALFIGTMLSTTFVGNLVHRAGLVKVLRFGAFLLPLSYALLSLSTGAVPFVLASLLCGLIMPLASTVPLSLLIQTNFKDHVGLALGIVMMGSGLGGMIFNPLGNALILQMGWRMAYRINSLIMLVCSLLVAFCIVKRQHDMPHGAEEPQETSKKDEPGKARPGISVAFMITLLMSFIMGAGSYASINFTSTYFQDIGYTSTYAAEIASISMGAMAIGKVVIGRLYDMFGVVKTTTFGVICLLIGMVGFVGATAGLPAIVAIVIGVGLGCPMGTVASSIILRHLYGDKKVGILLGKTVAISNFGAAITPMLAASMYGLSGSYRYVYVIVGAMTILSLFGYSYLFMRRRSGILR